MPEYLIRLAQAHESFRKVELQALADVAGVDLEFAKYEADVSPSCFNSIFQRHPGIHEECHSCGRYFVDSFLHGYNFYSRLTVSFASLLTLQHAK